MTPVLIIAFTAIISTIIWVQAPVVKIYQSFAGQSPRQLTSDTGIEIRAFDIVSIICLSLLAVLLYPAYLVLFLWALVNQVGHPLIAVAGLGGSFFLYYLQIRAFREKHPWMPSPFGGSLEKIPEIKPRKGITTYACYLPTICLWLLFVALLLPKG